MARDDINPIMARIDILAKEIDQFVSRDPAVIEFRADLAGLLVVAIVASYESCVKETIINYAEGHHIQFGVFVQNQFDKLSSRISIQDLHRYANTFGPATGSKFKFLLKKRRERLQSYGFDLNKTYERLLNWRHDFAHAGIRNTTVEEALITHRVAKIVVYAFNAAFI